LGAQSEGHVEEGMTTGEQEALAAQSSLAQRGSRAALSLAMRDDVERTRLRDAVAMVAVSQPFATTRKAHDDRQLLVLSAHFATLPGAE
jgi:hypothetical protein